MAIAADEHVILHAPLGCAVVKRTGIPSSDDEQTRARSARRGEREGIDRVVVPLPAPHTDLSEEKHVGVEAKFTPDRASIHHRVESLRVRSGVDDVNLVRPDAGRDETPLDRFAYRDNRGDSTSGVTEAIEPGERKAHAAVQDQDRDLHEQAGQQRERSGLSLLGVDENERSDRAKVDLRRHRHGVVRDPGLPQPRRPRLARPRRDDDLVAPPVESLGQLGQLNRGTGVVVRLRIELEDAEGLGQRQAPKNARTAATTRSISSSVWSADIGRLRISSTSRSVRGTASDAKHPTADWRWVGIG